MFFGFGGRDKQEKLQHGGYFEIYEDLFLVISSVFVDTNYPYIQNITNHTIGHNVAQSSDHIQEEQLNKVVQQITRTRWFNKSPGQGGSTNHQDKVIQQITRAR